MSAWADQGAPVEVQPVQAPDPAVSAEDHREEKEHQALAA